MCARLKTLKGRWLLTLQDCSKVRHEMAGHPLKAISRNKGIDNRKGKAGVYKEVIITDRR